MKLNTMKLNTFLLLPLSLCLLPARFAEAAPSQPLKIAGIPTTVHGGLVDMEAGGNFLTDDSISPFVAAMKAYPKARRYHLAWEMYSMGGSTDVHFLYNRRRHTLTVSIQGGDEDAKVTFRRVREPVFAAILRAHPTGHLSEDEASDKIAETYGHEAYLWGGFQFLYQRRYGCLFPAAPPPLAAPHATYLDDDFPTTIDGDLCVVEVRNDKKLSQKLSQNAVGVLISLTRSCPNANPFKLLWNNPVRGGAGSTSVSYDRVRHTLRVDSSGGGVPPQKESVLFTSVQESVLAAVFDAHPDGVPPQDAASRQIAQAHANNAADWGGFQYLYQRRYGCHAFIPRGGHSQRIY